MRATIAEQMHDNLLEVFNERDSVRVPQSSAPTPTTSDGPTTTA